MLLNACKICGSPAVLQVRGDLQEGERGWVPSGTSGQETSNCPANASDVRVACSNPDYEVVDRGIGPDKQWSCDAATGWNKQDFADYVEFCWNRDWGVSSQ